MANKRMINRNLIESDKFIELSHAAQVLYFCLILRADDDGFLQFSKRILRVFGVEEDNLQELLDKNLIIKFDSGVVAITHWSLHNSIRKDRYKPTVWQEEKSQLIDNGNGYERRKNEKEVFLVKTSRGLFLKYEN